MRRARSLLHQGLLLRSKTQIAGRLFQPKYPPRHHHTRLASSSTSTSASSAVQPFTESVGEPGVPLSATASSAGSGIVPAVSDGLLSAYETFSMDGTVFGWMTMLAATALSARAVSTPLLYYAQVQQTRAALASPEIVRIQAYLRTAPGNLAEKYFTFRRLRAVALASAGTSPARLFPWFAALNIPVFVTASLAIRRLADSPPDAWATAGPGGSWFLDLAAPDPTGALPIFNTALWLFNAHGRAARAEGDRPSREGANASRTGSDASSETGATNAGPKGMDAMPKPRSLFSGETITVALQAGTLLAYPFIQYAPSGMFVFWITSGLLTATQRAALGSDKIRQAIGLPTAEQLSAAARSRGPPVLRAAGSAVRNVRAQLEYVQTELLPTFGERKPDQELKKDVNLALARARRTGKIAIDLSAVIRVDEATGRDYIAVVRKGND